MTELRSYSDISEEDVAELLQSGRFDPQAYLERYPDVAQSGLDPARHYLWLGQKLGRQADPSSSPTLPTQKRSVSRPKVSRETDLDALFIDGTNGTSSTPYRVGRIALGLAKAGWNVRTAKGDYVKTLMEEGINGRITVFHRAPYWSPFIVYVDELRKLGTIIVFDIDDLVFDESVIPNIDGYRMLTEEQKRGFKNGVDAYRNFILNADMCTSTTSFLVEEIKKRGTPTFRVRYAISLEIIYTFERIGYQRRDRPSPFVMGYYSGTKTHQADFAVAAPALIAFMQENPDTVLRIIGELDIEAWPELEHWQHIHRPGDVPRVVRVGLMPHDVMIRDQFSCDVILAPLEVGNPFCEAKSELKFFEASLAQAPVIASATRTFKEASEDGRLAELAITTEDWKHSLDNVYHNYSAALDRARHAYDHVRYFYSQGYAANEALEAYEAFSSQISGTPLVEANDSLDKVADVAIILPDFTGPSGGHRKIFLVCEALVEAGLSVHLYFYTMRSSKVIERDIARFFGSFDLKISRFLGSLDTHKAAICTQWKSAYDFKNIPFNGQVFYFVQDFEPLFYACGSDYMRALVSYRQNFQTICYGRWVAAQLKDNVGVEASVISFTLDHATYCRPSREAIRDIDILVYARPDQDRRCFDLIVEGLIILKRHRPETKIALFGEENYPDFGFEFENLGSFSSLAELAALYRRTKVGVCYSPTNPSQLGYEMVACGACLIDVEIKYAELNFGGDDFVLYSNGLPEDMSAACQELLNDEGERERRQRAGYAFTTAMPNDDDLGRSFLEASGLGKLSRGK